MPQRGSTLARRAAFAACVLLCLAPRPGSTQLSESCTNGVSWKDAGPILRWPPAAKTHATTIEFAFGGEDVGCRGFLCKLNDEPQFLCSSPHTHQRLPEGTHLFTVTPPATFGLEPKNITLVVQPRFYLEPNNHTLEVEWLKQPMLDEVLYALPAPLPTGGAAPALRAAHFSVSKVILGFSYNATVREDMNASAFGTPVPDTDQGGLRWSLNEGLSFNTDDSAFEDDRMPKEYTAKVVVSDAADPSIISELVWDLTIKVYPRSFIIIFPPDEINAAGGGLFDSVVAGTPATQKYIWLINVAEDRQQNNFVVRRTACVASLPGSTLCEDSEPLVEVAPSTGVLAETGQVEQLNISFPQVLEVAQRLELTFEVAYTLNFVDQVPQLLQVVYQVVPDTISNKSAVSVVTAAAGGRVSGEGAPFTISAMDQYGNPLETVQPFLFDVFCVKTGVKMDFSTSPLQVNEHGNLTGSIEAVKPFGDYHVFVRFVDLLSGQQEVLTASPGTDWLDPAGTQLVGSPLAYSFSSRMCTAALFLMPNTDGDQCVCAAGYIPDVSAGLSVMDEPICVSCPRGSYRGAADSADTCTPCGNDRTTLADGAGAADQCVCDAGLYSEGADCLPCPKGTYQDIPNATACTLCPVGTYSALGAATLGNCTACDAMHFAHLPGTAECAKCPEGSRTEEDNRAECFCEPDHFMDFLEGGVAEAKLCRNCPTGAECANDRVVGQPDYWRKDTLQFQLYACTPGYCLGEEAVLTGAVGDMTSLKLTAIEQAGVNLSATCRVGHSGRLCAACDDGYALSGNFCALCKDGYASASSQLLVSALLISIVAALLALWILRPLYKDTEERAKRALFAQVTSLVGAERMGKLQRRASLKAGQAEAALRRQSSTGVEGSRNRARQLGDAGNHVLQAADFGLEDVDASSVHMLSWMQSLTRQYLKIIISFCQVLASFMYVYAIPWPETYLRFLSVADFVNLPVFALPGFSCIFPNVKFFNVLLLYFFIPILLVAWTALVYAGSSWALRRRAKRDVTVEFKLKSHAIRTVLVLLFLVYPALSAKMLAVFNCRKIHGTDYLQVDVNTVCHTSTHVAYQLLACVGIILYVLGIPLGFLGAMRYYKVHILAAHKHQCHVLRNILMRVAGKVKGVSEFLDAQPDDYHIYTELSVTSLRQIVAHLCPKVLQDPKYVELVEANDKTFESAVPADAVRASVDALRASAMRNGNGTAAAAAATAFDVGALSHIETELLEAAVSGEHAFLVNALMQWADDQPDNRALVHVPEISWNPFKDRDPKELTVYQKMEFHAISRVGFIFQMYHTRTWWYEILDLARKLVLTGLVAFIQKGSTTQVAVGVMICFIVLALNLDFSPFFNDEIDKVANIALLELLVTLYLGLLLQLRGIGEESADEPIFTLFLALLTAFVLVYPLSIALWSCVRPAEREDDFQVDPSVHAAGGTSAVIDIGGEGALPLRHRYGGDDAVHAIDGTVRNPMHLGNTPAGVRLSNGGNPLHRASRDAPLRSSFRGGRESQSFRQSVEDTNRA